jgi:hypothetical protein
VLWRTASIDFQVLLLKNPSLQDAISCCDPVYIIFTVDLLF